MPILIEYPFNVHFIAPNLFGFKGGIQVYSAEFLKALQQHLPDTQYRVFLKYDRPDHVQAWFREDTQFCCFGRWPRWLQSILMALALFWSAIRFPNSIMITTHVNYAIACRWIKFFTGTPYWIVAHGLEIWDVEAPQLKASLRQADRILAVSHYTRDLILREQQLAPEQVSVLPNLVDDQRFQIAPKPSYLLQRYGLKPEQKVILTVTRLGKLDTYKGYEQVLRSLTEIRQHIPDVHYLLVGKGDDTPRIQQLIQGLELQDHVTLTGFIPDQELADHYNLCDVFAMPSTGEGFGIVYLEALACGKPVLGGNVDGTVDPLLHGKLGALINPDDVSEIAQALTQILQGEYPNPSMYQPQILRQETLQRFERSKFYQRVAYLAPLLAEKKLGSAPHPLF